MVVETDSLMQPLPGVMQTTSTKSQSYTVTNNLHSLRPRQDEKKLTVTLSKKKNNKRVSTTVTNTERKFNTTTCNNVKSTNN